MSVSTAEPRKHIFRQDAPRLMYAALGDTAVRVVAIHHAIRVLGLDAVVIPQRNPSLRPLWEWALGPERVTNIVPDTHGDATTSPVTDPDWAYAQHAYSVFESVWWESALFSRALHATRIDPPNVFPCNPDVNKRARAALLYPAERTDGNRVYDSDFWVMVCQQLRRHHHRLHLLGDKGHPALASLFRRVKFDAEFAPSLEGLRLAASASTLAIGASTGPTWALLMSDIPQIVLESNRSHDHYWRFSRCAPMLAKPLRIMPTLEALL